MAEKLRVLLIEDSDEDAELVLRFVRKFSKDVYHERVQTEEELRKAFAKEKWDLVLSDYNLPKFSGLEAIKVLKESKIDTPLILVSGTIGEETAVEALKTGASDYVLKSNLGRLTTAIEHTIRKKETEVENRKLVRQLEQAQKMEAVGRLAGGIAHDVNNALAAITIYAETAIEQIGSSELPQAQESLRGILSAQRSAAGIVRQLLSFSRRNFEPTKTVDFSSVIQRVQPLVKTLLGENIELKIQYPSQKVQVLANPIQIEQVIMNLAVNSRDAMTGEGTFALSLDIVKIDSSPTDAPIAPGEYACLSARDSGCGMSSETLERIFEPFFTTKEVGKGTGLGLSVIYGIVNQARGTILVESEVGRGTEFRVLWPISMSAVAVEDKIDTKAHAVAEKKSSTILLVEDEESLRLPLAATLRKRGYTVIEASNGEEAFRIMGERDLAVDLLISDMVMPRMGGPELAKKVREKISSVSVLFLSGYADDTLEEYRIDVASTWFLQKPFTSKAFIEKVTAILNGDTPPSPKDS